MNKITVAPKPGEAVRENPPRFVWPPLTGQAFYRLEIATDQLFQHVIQDYPDLDYNFFTPPAFLPSGQYYWRVSANGAVLYQQQVTVPDAAEIVPLLPRQERYRQLSAHPRLWLTGREINVLKQRIRHDLKETWANFITRSVEPWLSQPIIPEPDYYPNHQRVISIWRQMFTNCQYALHAIRHLSVAYRVTGDQRYLIKAKAWLLHLAAWDVNGPTARTYNDESSFRVALALAWGYDWLYDELSDSERQTVRTALNLRAGELANFVMNQIRIHVDPLDSHGVRAVSQTLVPAALALYGEIPDAEDWLNYAIEYYMALYSPWGGADGGWAEGPMYWTTGMAFVMDALHLLKKSTGIDIFRRPFFGKTGDFPLHVFSPDAAWMGFGDMSNLGEQPGLKTAFNIRLLAGITGNGFYQWYYEQVAARDTEADKKFFNYGWWDFPFDELVYRFDYPSVQAVKPAGDAFNVKWFQDVGWVALHDQMDRPEQHIFFLTKASPYGAVSHSHGDQNAFLLHAYGEPLAIHSGHYIGFWSTMHINWRRQTKSKNAILIDGAGRYCEIRKASQTDDLNGSGKSTIENLLAANGVIEAVEQRNKYVYISGDATNAYRQTVPYPKSYKRKTLFIDQLFFVLVDEVELDRPGTISWLMHTLSPLDLEGQSFSLEREKAGLDGRFICSTAGPLHLAQKTGFEDVDPTEVAGLDLQWHFTATTPAAASHRIVTLLYPYKAGEREHVYVHNQNGNSYLITIGTNSYQLQEQHGHWSAR